MPDDYHPAEMEPARGASTPLRREVSAEERRRVEQDPVVRQTLELFDGIVIQVERRPAAAVAPEAE